MSDSLHRAIQEIAVKHGVVLGKDDPILILQTMNERLLTETQQAQQKLLQQFKEEMELISSQWKDDAKDKAEKVLNAALASSKEAMTKLLQESTKESVLAMKKMISDSLVEARGLALKTQKLNRFTLLSSAIILIGSCLFMLFFEFYILH